METRLNKLQREVLEKAFPLIQNPDTFTKDYLARDEGNIPIEPTNPHAVCWCSVGAVMKVANDMGVDYADIVYNMHEVARVATGGVMSVSEVNDRRSHAAVVQFWKDYLLK